MSNPISPTVPESQTEALAVAVADCPAHTATPSKETS